MTAPNLSNARWWKSSRSTDNGQCLEIAFVEEGVAVRDSKDPAGPVLEFSPAAWSTFVATAATSTFNTA